MDLRDMSFKECLLLGRRAEHECARFFRTLATRLLPEDDRFARPLHAMAAEEEAHEVSVTLLDDRIAWPHHWRLDEAEVRRTLEEHFPTLYSSMEDLDTLDAETIRFLVRSVEDESVRFYKKLAAMAPDARSRTSLRRIAQEEAEHRSLLA